MLLRLARVSVASDEVVPRVGSPGFLLIPTKLFDGLLVAHFPALPQRINVANQFHSQAVLPAPRSSALLRGWLNLHSRDVRQRELYGQNHPGVRLIRADRVPVK